MRILHVIPAVAPRYGGPSQVIFEMCRALVRRGLDVMIATTDVDGSGRLPLQTGIEIEYQGVPTILFRGLGERFNYSPTLAGWLEAHAGEFQVAHIHAVFSHPCIAAARACRKHHTPYIVRPLGSLDPWSMRQKPLRKRLMWQMAAGRMIREAAAIHYTTDEEKRLAESSLSLDHGIVIPLGVELETNPDLEHARSFRAKHPAIGDRPYVLAFSRIHPKKNIELLIESFVKLANKPEVKHWRLVVAGDGDASYLRRLRELVDERSAQDKILFAGWIDGALKASTIQQAALFALTSQHENFGVAAAEALARGVPVVLSEQVNLAIEIERANAGWVTSLDAGQLSRVLLEAMTNDEERERRGRAGKVFVEDHLSWEKVARELEGMYSSVASSCASVCLAV